MNSSVRFNGFVRIRSRIGRGREDGRFFFVSLIAVFSRMECGITLFISFSFNVCFVRSCFSVRIIFNVVLTFIRRGKRWVSFESGNNLSCILGKSSIVLGSLV